MENYRHYGRPGSFLKFIAAIVTTPEGERYVVRSGDETYDYHRVILRALRREASDEGLPDDAVAILGGGMCIMRMGTLHLHGRSTDFGLEPDRNATVVAFAEAYPDTPVRTL